MPKHLPGKAFDPATQQKVSRENAEIMTRQGQKRVAEKLVNESLEQAFGDKAQERLKVMGEQQKVKEAGERKEVEARRTKRRMERKRLEKEIQKSLKSGEEDKAKELLKEKFFKFHFRGNIS